jgi:hypothetical protein
MENVENTRSSKTGSKNTNQTGSSDQKRKAK